MNATALLDGIGYLRQRPHMLFSLARNVARRNVGVPLDLLRWFIERRPRGKGPERIEVQAAPPGIGVGLTVDLYGTKIDVSANIEIEHVQLGDSELPLTLRVRDLRVKAPEGSPAAMMFSTLDFSKPGNLLNMMPVKHNALVEVDGDRFVIDLMKIPGLGSNKTVKRVIGALSDVFSIREVRTDDDLLLVGLGTNLLALPSAIARLRA